MKKNIISLILTAVAVTSGCNGARDDADVVGTYVLNEGKARDVLELRSDGTYIHRYGPKFGPDQVDSAAWNLVSSNGRAQIEFKKFSHHSRREFFPGELVVRGFWIVEVETTWRRAIRLPVDTDIGLYYIRE